MVALIMLGVAIVCDFFVFRNVLVLLIAILLKIVSCCKCSHWRLSMGGKILREIWNMMWDVIKDADSKSEQVINIKEALEMEASVISWPPN